MNQIKFSNQQKKKYEPKKTGSKSIRPWSGEEKDDQILRTLF